MAKVENSNEDSFNSYRVAAAARRAKIAASAQPILCEVKPANGRISVTLGARPLNNDHQKLVFGPSSIQIPEFLAARRSKAKPD